MFFLSLSIIDVKFAKLGKLIWRLYTAIKALLTTSWVKLTGKREFAQVALDENSETFVVYVSALEAMTIHPSWAVQIATLQYNKTLTEIPTKYSDYADVILIDLAMELS